MGSGRWPLISVTDRGQHPNPRMPMMWPWSWVGYPADMGCAEERKNGRLRGFVRLRLRMTARN